VSSPPTNSETGDAQREAAPCIWASSVINLRIKYKGENYPPTVKRERKREKGPPWTHSRHMDNINNINPHPALPLSRMPELTTITLTPASNRRQERLFAQH